MKGATALALCVLSVSAALAGRPGDASAALIVGELDGVTLYASQMGVPEGTPFPFGLVSEDGLANQGVPVTVSFVVDTARLPPNQDAPSTQLYRFEESAPADPWLTAQIGVNGSVVPIDTRYLVFGEWRSPGSNGDGLFFGMGDATSPTTIQVLARAPDFGAGDPLWSSLDAVSTAGAESIFQFIYGPSSAFGLTFAVTHLELHPLPEPTALVWLALAALPLARHRKASP
ncbi:MAG TPA: hypothetical protein VMR50_05780 [Myxococcota bacterium]|nr:hypothetical protein [Myxococcota bacterium]